MVSEASLLAERSSAAAELRLLKVPALRLLRVPAL
jgi:hypothetical protein